ncbi:phosphoesterase [Flavobacterium zepuense]|uniref:Phosphoesterase n=1 Tax=Flavobacterium zepuense TaxID=2593302 RepID=A0A552VA54_9FLAO|nr:ShlB/FhaC/HecB family hemolysin secretion/activation protein [Flavobacterium zepuense]TRW27329.1 phosphoesterase [Flavobacterium zepuense]
MKTKITILFLFSLLWGYAQQGGDGISHTFYTIGNTGDKSNNNAALTALGNSLKNAGDNTTVLFLGNNASAKGFSEDNDDAVERLTLQTNLLKGFKGNVFFMPGYSDWHKGLKGLKKEADFITKALGNEKAFKPQKGCPMEKIKINSDVDLLILDSQWALTDWDKLPGINDDCDIKSKNQFYTEVEAEIVKSEGKTVLIALYHPIVSYGKYGSSYAFGISPQQLNNKYYKELSSRLITLALRFKNVAFVSGHENNMQYITGKDEVPVIIAGSAASGNGIAKGPDSKFNSAEAGFSKITAYIDGSLNVAFYGESNNFSAPLFESIIITPDEKLDLPDYNEYQSPQYVEKSIYSKEELEHSGIFKALWGDHYRNDYLAPIKLKTALLDTLYGGLTPVRKGGGHQTNSLRLKDKSAAEYTMRNTKKSALRFIQYFLFKMQYLAPDVADTYFIKLLEDYWTTANPYAALTMGDIADALEIYHANPQVYYIPKQKALGNYNDNYGDQVYFIEEQANDGQGKNAGFGYHDKIIGTGDFLEEMRRKDKVTVNENVYIRTRLLDNILGDFDRHADQWRWTEDKKEDGTLFYTPIPRDRDQAFSDFDGFMIGAITTLNPPLRFMQRYTPKYKHIRWFNDAGDDVDRAVLINDTEEDWAREAKYIKEHLTPEIVDKAFAKFPEGLDEAKKAKIKAAFLGRISKVEELSHDVYSYLKSFVMITGTDKDDWFIITRKPNGVTNVKGYRIQQGQKGTLFWDVDYDKKVTKEIWIYGLDDKDIFEVEGDGNKTIPIKIIGGKNNDTYRINRKSNVHVYDQKSMPNTFETSGCKTLTDDYEVNTYDFMKGRKDISQILPQIGFNPDDGLAVGAAFSYTKNSLVRNPFTAQHNVKALYYTATSGVNLSYAGEFAHVLGKLNLGIGAGYTSPFYAYNFFGFGNTTPDNDNMDYNRVRIRTAYVNPSLLYRGYYGSIIRFGLKYENIESEKTEDRYIAIAPVNPKVFDEQTFYTAEASYSYNNFDNAALPKKGIGFSLSGGYKANFDEDKGYAYIVPEVRLTTKIDRKGILTYATKLKAQHIFNNDFEFYQAATIGDQDGLRGFRKQRFSGKTSYYQNSDLRLSLGRLSNSFIPASWGVYGGFDYGRVWIDGENSDKWHTSVGGGLLFNLAGFTTANVAFFNSSDGGRLTIGLQLMF